ncbi:MAG: D-aminoacyl-tRNA deacylase [Bifidobacterium psychraerophilum]
MILPHDPAARPSHCMTMPKDIAGLAPEADTLERMRIVLQRVRRAQLSVVDDTETETDDVTTDDTNNANDPDNDTGTHKQTSTPASDMSDPSGDGDSRRIGTGLLLLVGVQDSDGDAEVEWMAHKIAHMRIFEDAAGKMNRSVLEEHGSVLSVSQFTLYADTRKGNRPSFTKAGRPEHADTIWNAFNAELRAYGIAVAEGVFGAHMLVGLENDGPVTIILDSDNRPTG